MKTKLSAYSNIMYDCAKRIEKEIIDYMAEADKEFIDLQADHNNGEPIYAYVYNEETGVTEELEIVAICTKCYRFSDPDSISLLVQYPSTTTKTIWTIDDIKDSWYLEKNDDWYPLFGGDLLGVLTAYNLADSLDYLEI